MIPLSRAGLALAFALIAGASAPAQSQNGPLRWKFQPGQELKYVQKQQTISTANANGQPIENKLEQTFHSTWKIQSVRPDGTAAMTQSFDRVQFAMQSPTGNGGFDTNDKDAKPEGRIAVMAAAFHSIIGKDVTMTMAPNGQIHDVSIPEAVAEGLQKAGVGADGKPILSTDTLKGIIEQSGVALPDKPLKPGDNFQIERDVPSPIGSMHVVTTYTYKGPEKSGSTVERFDIEIKTVLKPKDDLPFKVKLGEQDARGELRFDRQAGRTLSSSVSQKLDMTLEVSGQQIEQSTTSKVEYTLTDAAGSTKK